MKYLSVDIEATGLKENDYLIEFGMIPFDTDTMSLNDDLARNYYVVCPSFEELKPSLDPWVIENNENIINQAHKNGISIADFQKKISEYVNDSEVLDYFFDGQKERISLFGKSVNSIDIPFLNRDLGWDFMKEHFHHRILDLSATARSLIDLNMLPKQCDSGSGLMKYLGYGDVAHTALTDARNTALMYLSILEKFTRN
ncbi:MAG: exonuclease domain-containing protein [Bdellovibrionales bacterium]|jgi:DNA polymerase-3 subunit epsilon|nr:exonuclease domain-containing protein [Bdellovibrionales bacterium]